MVEQNLGNHARFVRPFHFGVAPMFVIALLLSIAVLVRAFLHGSGRLEAVVLVLLALAGGLLSWYARKFALKAQDRAIRAEENLRHMVLTGKPLDRRLRLMQIVALRFAGDEEFVALAQKAADEGMRPVEIKRAVQRWRADHDRA